MIIIAVIIVIMWSRFIVFLINLLKNLLGGRHYGSLSSLLESFFRHQHCPRSL